MFFEKMLYVFLKDAICFFKRCSMFFEDVADNEKTLIKHCF